MTFYTVGHSNRPLEEFLTMLGDAGVGLVVDVRRLPGSRACPWFDQEQLAPALREVGIDYVHEVALTGRRPRQPDVLAEVNALWRNQSFHNYADYALSDEFAAGLARVREAAAAAPALLCSEAVWWRCHRRIIADHLLAQGDPVEHIMETIVPATLTPGASVRDGQVTYPAP